MSHREQRACPVCSATFTWNSNRPTHRFCGPKCKAIWAREIKKARELGLPPPTPGDARLRPGPTAPARHTTLHGDPLRGQAPHEDLLTAATTGSRQTCCPHCRKPIAVVAMLVPPAAVHVDTPSQSVANIN